MTVSSLRVRPEVSKGFINGCSEKSLLGHYLLTIGAGAPVSALLPMNSVVQPVATTQPVSPVAPPQPTVPLNDSLEDALETLKKGL